MYPIPSCWFQVWLPDAPHLRARAELRPGWMEESFADSTPSLIGYSCVCIYIYIYTHTRLHICTCTYMHACIHTYIHVCMYAYMYVCMCACMHACTHVCMCDLCIYRYIYIYSASTVHQHTSVSLCTRCVHAHVYIYICMYIHVYVYLHTCMLNSRSAEGSRKACIRFIRDVQERLVESLSVVAAEFEGINKVGRHIILLNRGYGFYSQALRVRPLSLAQERFEGCRPVALVWGR